MDDWILDDWIRFAKFSTFFSERCNFTSDASKILCDVDHPNDLCGLWKIDLIFDWPKVSEHNRKTYYTEQTTYYYLAPTLTNLPIGVSQ